jgi:hypothetical protein
VVTRGLFRVWLVAAALWVAFCWSISDSIDLLVSHMQTVTYPPLVVLAVSTSLIWAVRGFK